QSSFPGHSLASHWRETSAKTAPPGDASVVISELSSPNPINPSHGRSPAARGPLVSIADDEYVYIRNQRNGRELLFRTSDDPDELDNLAKMDAMLPRLQRYRERLGEMPEGSRDGH
ncbi:hypothetical protein ACYOEI_41595, partial [Singulisphaera rosea]